MKPTTALNLVVLCCCGLAAAYDWSKGCPRGVSYVCGQDGITYQNYCLAAVQDVKVVRPGKCDDQKLQLFSTPATFRAAPYAGPPIDLGTVHKYAKEGFRLVGTASRGTFRPQASYVRGKKVRPPVNQLMSVEALIPPKASFVSAIRMTREGLVYRVVPPAAQSTINSVRQTFMAASDDGQDMPGYNPHQQQQKQQLAFKQQLQLGQEGKVLQKQHRSKPQQRDYLLDIVSYGRKLLLAPLSSRDTSFGSALQRSLKYIIGQDDRFEVTDIPQWPFTAVGQFLYKNGSCSGVMIGPRSVLTAGHCVFNRKKQLWQQDIVFIPGRHRKGNVVVEPFGRIPFDSITTYSGWVENVNTTDSMKYDLAVVRLVNESAGMATGWLGVSWDKTGYRGNIFSAGYPGDKARGTQWISTCNITDANGSDTRFVNACDVWPGQSGSPMMEVRQKEQYYMRAVLTYESCKCCSPDCKCCKDPFNGGCAINALHYANILNWR